MYIGVECSKSPEEILVYFLSEAIPCTVVAARRVNFVACALVIYQTEVVFYLSEAMRATASGESAGTHKLDARARIRRISRT